MSGAGELLPQRREVRLVIVLPGHVVDAKHGVQVSQVLDVGQADHLPPHVMTPRQRGARGS